MQSDQEEGARPNSSPAPPGTVTTTGGKNTEEFARVSSASSERRVQSSHEVAPQLSSRYRHNEEEYVPTVTALNRQLDDLACDVDMLNDQHNRVVIPEGEKVPLKSVQHLQGKPTQPPKQRLPHINGVQSARSVLTPKRKGRQSPRYRASALPALSSSPPRSRDGASFARPFATKSAAAQSSRVVTVLASVRSASSPHRPVCDGAAVREGSAAPVTLAEESQTDTKQCGLARTRGGRIRVVVRKRPLPSDEDGCDCVSVDPPNVKVAVRRQRVDLTEYADVSDFTFDDVYSEDKCNEHVFNSCCRELLEITLRGGSASCFAYGQTGSGKTHTMLGNNGERGLCILAAAAIFDASDKNQDVYASLYEIYCNSLFDLLNNRSPVVVREDHNRRMHITGLTWRTVASADELQMLINSGTDQRSTGCTTANERSSRSHAVLTIQVRDRDDIRFCGTLNLVDLAGSERAADTATNDRQTRQEGAEINKSLLALKECIRALDEKKKHVPFRGSKLTEILRDSFIGNSRTVMIANISASSQNCEHTLNTLRYAFRVKGLSIANFEPSRARNVLRPLKPIASDSNGPLVVAQAGGATAKAMPGQWKPAPAATAPANKRNGNSANLLVQRHNSGGCGRSPYQSGAQDASDDESFTACIRRIARAVAGGAPLQSRVEEIRGSSSPKRHENAQDDGSSARSVNEPMKMLEDRVVVRMMSDVMKLIRDAALRRERVVTKLRNGNAILGKVNSALEKRAAECPHCRGAVIRQTQQQPQPQT